MPTRTIVAMGGLAQSAINNDMERYLLSLCDTNKPRVCFVPTASGDSQELEADFTQRFRAFPCEFSVVRLFHRDLGDLAGHLRAQDLIVVGGGNTANLLALWSLHGVDIALTQAWKQGVVLAGWSAGALCWFESGVTDSFGPNLKPLKHGLGLLSGSFCPHFEDPARKRAFEDLVARRELEPGLAADTGVALRFSGRDLVEAVSLIGGGSAYRVSFDEAAGLVTKQLATRSVSPAEATPAKTPAAKRKPAQQQATVAYTDGACSGNPGPGGWAWAVRGNSFASGAESHTTNQRMEVTAAYQAVLAHEGPLEVVSDSTYVVNCFKQRWWEGWLKRGWINSQRRPVANRDLWEPFIDLVRRRGNVSFTWVKGHSSDQMNRFVDQLAVEASQSQQGRSGRCPSDLT